MRAAVEKAVKSGPEMVTLGKLPQTPRAKRAIEHAIGEAHDLNHNYVGTEHLLLGLLREQDGLAAQILKGLGVQYEQARAKVIELINPPAESMPGEEVPSQPPPAKRSTEEFSRTDSLGQLLLKAITELGVRKDKAAWHGQHELAGQMHEMAQALRGILQRLAAIADDAQGDQTSG